MRSLWCMIAAVIGLATTIAAGPADDKLSAKQEKPRLRKLTAPWDYPGARVLQQVDLVYGTVRLQTTDDIDKVYRHYEKLATKGKAEIALPGGFALTQLNGKINAFLDLSQIPDDADPTKRQDRPAKVRVLVFHVDPFTKMRRGLKRHSEWRPRFSPTGFYPKCSVPQA